MLPRLNTREVVRYALMAAYIVFLLGMLVREDRRDRQIATIEARTSYLCDNEGGW